MKPGSILLGAAIGLSVGALAGVIFETKKGLVTSRFLDQKGRDYVGGMKDRYNESLNRVNQKIESLKDEVKNIMSKGKKEYKSTW